MSATIRLPLALVKDDGLDLGAINGRLRSGAVRLDWSATREATPEALAALLDGLDLANDADTIGIETIHDSLSDPVAEATARNAPDEAAGPQTARPTTTRTPREKRRPAIWTAPRPEEGAQSESASAPTPVEQALPARPQVLVPPSAVAIRDELGQLVLADLLGPAGGPEEELLVKPRDYYLVGMLAPRKQRVEPEEQDELAEAGPDAPEDGPTDLSALQTQTMSPSSFGLTCCVDSAATAILVTASWGAYRRERSEHLVTKSGAPRLVWKRAPFGELPHIVPLTVGPIASWTPDPAQQDVRARGMVRTVGGAWLVTIWLVNEQQDPQRSRDRAWLFQPELVVEAPDGAPIFRKRARVIGGTESGPTMLAEDQAMAMLYRRHVEFAVGHSIGVHVDLAAGDSLRAMRIRTAAVPTYEVPPTTSADATDYPALRDLTLDMAVLSQVPDGEFAEVLGPLLDAYEGWIVAQSARIEEPGAGLAPFQDIAHDTIDKCRQALSRIRDGIVLLDRDRRAADAFRFANRAMWQQRIRALLIEARRGGEPATLTTIDLPRNRSWRLFQLAFILLNLPALTDLHHEDRAETANAHADLLWFPTGGGKTEAYLGLTAYTLAIRRLQGTVAGRSGMDGVAVLMRYTLRLLTLQQFQRAAALICACEMIRRDAREHGDRRWGDTPFRLGLWVGQRTTPNTTMQAAEAVKRDHGAWTGGASGSGSPAQLVAYPWCGTPIDPGKDIVVDKDLGRTILYCGDPHGDCPYSRKGAPREGLPVLVVDEEIYRRLPALLISTVDKFAQMPWRGETQMLFGQVDGYCPRHGFRSPEITDSASHPARNGLPAVKSQPHGALRPPDLIIQDELHLISGPLGTLVGLYETVVDRLCTWEIEGVRVRPKVIASTATVRRASDQLRALFLRQGAVFPPQGLDASDNFFALQRQPSDVLPGRRYIGICAPGTRLKAVLIRVYVAHLAAAQMLYDRYGERADPWMTLAGYFNSMRELGGMRRLVEDDVRTRLGLANERGLAKRRPPVLEELTSRKGSTDIPLVLQRLETAFDPDQEARTLALRKAGKKVTTPVPIDVLLATNMISVGVDVKRLGLMVVAGQPKTTAEYIQATSRVGRTYPGLVCTVFNWARPRDLSHYEQFEHYHGGFYQHVEALSVTPFAARAIDRGLSGLLVAYLRLIETTMNANDRAGRLDRTNPYVERAIAEIAARAGEVTGRQEVADLVRAELNERVDVWIAEAQRTTGGRILGYRDKKDGVTLGLLRTSERGTWDTFTCLNSLRDVEQAVGLILDERPLGNDDDRPFTAASVSATSADGEV